LAQALHKEFPKSPAMYLAEIIDYYELKDWSMVKTLAQDFLEKSSHEIPLYTQDGVYPGWYCLGVAALWGDHDVDTCLMYMEKIAADPETTSRWVAFAYLRMGQVYDQKGNREKALTYYRKVLKRPDFWGSHTEAHRYIKTAFHF
jgi:hypothetical protein